MYVFTRYYKRSENYKYFYNFDFEDYLQRKRVFKTFDIRFLARTQGTSKDTFGIKDPPEWDLEVGEEVVVTNSVAKRAISRRQTIPSVSVENGW